MKQDHREVLTPARIQEDLIRMVKKSFWMKGVEIFAVLLFGLYIVFLLLYTKDSLRPEYRAIIVASAVLIGLCALTTVALIMLHAWKQKHMVVEGQYEALEDTLVNALPNRSPFEARATDLYFEHCGPLKKRGSYKGDYGTPYVIVIFKDRKGRLACMYSTREYRLERPGNE